MMLTREQAAETWCPMARSASSKGGTYNRITPTGEKPGSCCCIADKCAMWRWGEFKESREHVVREHAPDSNGNTRSTAMEPVKLPVAGYCGLAGRPA